MAPPANAYVSKTPVVPQPKAPASSLTPVVAQPFYSEKSKVKISIVALRKILLPIPTETELATSNGMRLGFAQDTPSEKRENARAYP